ncbi:MAG: alpha-glucosidase [Firmicutes bacterium]|nr:alpha-glucosidase [Bacillota bacterium]
MLYEYIFGRPIETYALAEEIQYSRNVSIDQEDADFFPVNAFARIPDGLLFKSDLPKGDFVYGLGETMRGINKRGGRYISYNTDDAHHRVDMPSLYSSHNWFVISPPSDASGRKPYGLFFDTPARTTFDLDSDGSETARVKVESQDLRLVYVTGETVVDVCRQFLQVIGRSFLPPLWAFGFGQSRWGYESSRDVRRVAARYQREGLPLDYICLDIGYMDRFIDFTINPKKIPDLKALVEEMKVQGIRLVPIIDAGIKVEPGNPVYDEGIRNGYFVTNEQGEPFKAAVWPGMTHFPDFFKANVRRWFGDWYRVLTRCGIEGVWNDMNEPSIFYSERSGRLGMVKMGLNYVAPRLAEKYAISTTEDYQHMYHHLDDGTKRRHHDIHNVFGALMTRASGEGLNRQVEGRYLLFSRSSYIGAHRYGGMWTGDNYSSWAHLRQNVKQMPGLNMCGFLYSGADTGGFGGNCTRELLLRWLAFSCFTPLMRDHSATRTRDQESYAFGDTEDFRRILSLRYRILPYLYSEFMKAALRCDLLIRPLSFDFPDDPTARKIEDQLMIGESLMIAPVVQEGAEGRMVYLPEDMSQVRYAAGQFFVEEVPAGMRQVQVPIDQVVFYIRKGKAIVAARAPEDRFSAENTKELDLSDVELLGTGETYSQYLDDGISKACSLDNIRIVQRKR